MSQDRSDRDAARRRIEDLEAQLAEREAALSSGDAAVAACDAELARLRRQIALAGVPDAPAGPAHASRAARVLVLAVAACSVAIAGGAVALRSPRRCAVASVSAPAVAQPPVLADPVAAAGAERADSGPVPAIGADRAAPAPEERRALLPGADAPDDFDLELRVGAKLLGSGHALEAIDILERARKERPNSAEANHWLGRALLVQGDRVPSAMRYLELATNIDGSRAEYHFYLGRVAGDAGQPAKARAALERAVILAETPGQAPAPWLYLAHHFLGRAYEKLGDSQKALDEYRRYFELAPPGDAHRRGG